MDVRAGDAVERAGTVHGGGVMDTSDVISLGAIAIALIALLVSIAEATANRPRIRVTHYQAIGVGALEGEWLVVSVINWGRQPTTISSVSIELQALVGDDGASCHAAHVPGPAGEKAPHFLEVGREGRFFFSLDARIANITTTDIGKKTLRELMEHYGARARIHTSWRARAFRKTLSQKKDDV
jgi:hypothetical protein